MKLPNGYGSVTKMKGKRRNPYMVRKTVAWHYDARKDRQIVEQVTYRHRTMEELRKSLNHVIATLNCHCPALISCHKIVNQILPSIA